MSITLSILDAGTCTTIQDRGRSGYAYYAIPRSGAMDTISHDQANMIVGNKSDSPTLEFTQTGGSIALNGTGGFALTGADMEWTLNGSKVALNKCHYIFGKNILASKKALSGLRSYMSISGTWRVDKVMGSYATCLSAQLGPLGGRPLKKGNTIEIESIQNLPRQILDYPSLTIKKSIKIFPGPEYHLLQNKRKLLQPFTISLNSNRMGARLTSKTKLKTSATTIKSSAVFPGIIQLTPEGNPIVILQDGQTTGGYPRIGIIPEEDLPFFNQIAYGQQVRFELVV